MKKKVLILCCVCILFSGCGNRNKHSVSVQKIDDTTVENEIADSDEIYMLDFEADFNKIREDTFTINSIAKDIKFIPLETTDKSLLSYEYFVFAKINDRYCISSGVAFNFSGILEFDSTGRFVSVLIKRERGHGPQELFMWRDWTFHHSTDVFFVFGMRDVLKYSFDDNSIKKYRLNIESWEACLLNDGTMVDLPNWMNHNGDTDTPYLNFRNMETEIVHSTYYAQKQDVVYTIDPEGKKAFSLNHKLYPTYTGDALFQETFNDTIYRIKGMGDIKPFLVLNRGSLTPLKKDVINPKARSQKIQIERVILDTKNYIFIKYKFKDVHYSAVWNKQTRSFIANIKGDHINEEFSVCNSFYSNGFTRYRTPVGKEILIGIGFLEGKLYGVLDAEQAMEFLPDIKDDDNPVLMIIDL